jgi:hypothetical protein
MKKKTLVLVAVAVGIICACSALIWNHQRSKVAELFGGSDAFAILQQPSKVEAYRLNGIRGGGSLTGYGQSKVLDDYAVISGPVPVPQELARQLASVLMSYNTYGWNYGKACDPIYGARLGFVDKEGHSVDVVFCFECDILAVYRDGKLVRGKDFDAARPHFVRAMKILFPQDKAMQSLKE